MSSIQKSSNEKPAQELSKTQQNIGATWSNSGNLNIDLDNLLTGKQNKQSTAPSMNQLASNPTSPVNQPRLINQNSLGSPGFNNFPVSNFGIPNFNQPQPQNNQFFAGFK